VLLLLSGLYFPVAAAAMGLATIVGRFIYSVGYANGGPSGRFIGVLINDLCILGFFGLAVASGAMMIQGKGPL
jgi:glutathione S-transferase